MKKRFITHVIVPHFTPGPGVLQKLFFYTRHIPGKYLSGTGNNSVSQEQMDRRVSDKKLIRLAEEIELTEKRGLWFNDKGEVFYASSLTPNADPEKKLLFVIPELLQFAKKKSTPE